MAMMTGAEYIDSLRKLDTKVYMFGERVPSGKEAAEINARLEENGKVGNMKSWVDHPIIKPSINSIAATYDLANEYIFKDIMTATSGITDNVINRFVHIHQSLDDLNKKAKMLRLLGQKTGSGFQRFVGADALNAIFSTTYECDRVHDTKYHENFKNYMKLVEENDWTVDGAMTDPRGDRGKGPKNQTDSDFFLHIVEKREDGIVVKGAKVHQSGAVNSHEQIVMPAHALDEDEKEYAVSFACPSDAEGVFMVYGRQPGDTRKLERDADIDLGNRMFGSQEALVVFDNVFIPSDRIFLCEEYEFAKMMADRFDANYRHSLGSYKAGVGDVIIGGAALIAEYNGVGDADHIKAKLAEMTHLNETLYSCSIACSAEAKQTDSGNYQVDLLLASVCKENVSRFPYEISRLAEDIAGGLIGTLPSQADFKSELRIPTDSDKTLGEWCDKLFKGSGDVSTEDRIRVLRFLENNCMGTGAVGYLTESMHAGGSPQIQKLLIGKESDIESKKSLAKILAGIQVQNLDD